IPPEEAYGARRPELVRTIPRDRLPPDLDLVVGGEYGIATPDGKRVRFRVLDVTADEVRADFNPRTAAPELLATVTVVDVRGATATASRTGPACSRSGCAPACRSTAATRSGSRRSTSTVCRSPGRRCRPADTPAAGRRRSRFPGARSPPGRRSRSPAAHRATS